MRAVLGVLLGVAVLSIVVLVLVVVALDANVGSGFDRKQADALEAEFERVPEAFVAVDARMQELADAYPDAERISWTRYEICVGNPGQTVVTADCGEASEQDQETFVGLPGADAVIWQKKDDGFTFVRFHREDPPMLTIMHAAVGTDVKEFADDRGFESSRDLGQGWTLLGEIPDPDQHDAQWS